MAINFRKLKKQIYKDWNGYIFFATDEQKNNFIGSVHLVNSSKRTLIRLLVEIIKMPDNQEWQEEFIIQ